MTTPATDIEPVLAGVLQLLQEKPDLSLDALAEKVAAPGPAKPSPEAAPFPDLPGHAVLDGEALAVLKNLTKVFNSVEIDKRRALTEKEIVAITAERVMLSQLGAALAARDKIIAETMRVHMDVDAEESGRAVPKDKLGPDGEVIVAATPRDQHGHYLLAGPKEPYQVPAGAVKWSQEFSQSPPTPNDGVLQAAHKGGDIDREDYLAVTRETRVFDPERARAYIRKSPEKGLKVLRRIAVTGPAKSSLYLRKVT
jgi:hypothetical protein